MSSMKCVGIMAVAGTLLSGGLSLYNGAKARKNIIAHAQQISDINGGKIPTGGMTKDGKFNDGFTTVNQIKKDTGKSLITGSAITSAIGGALTALVSSCTLLAKKVIK